MENAGGVVKTNGTKNNDFWSFFAEMALRSGIPEGRVKWHLGWAQQFARSVPGSLFASVLLTM
ncbi:hypothetical protein DESUT3_30800 [Desulfuromonas versatilis]|uniref:Uncharacterized protein n=1 Tax=Desulfuromonas versatilis TaxID=2802975 RepID=A0ABN6E4I6_9BACT|nr:hypothetical protein DESUT3_30800 [Desulfuromonas versatilis]